MNPSRASLRSILSTGLALSLILIFCGTCNMAAAQGKRAALLIGNGDYLQDTLDLDNPVNDVNSLGERLQQIGFDVEVLRDVESDAMSGALDRFAQASQDAEMALFFYAGHGVQLGGENYLVGVGLEGFRPEPLVESSLDLTRIKNALLEARPDISIVILDACRNNPFSETDQITEGLAQAGGGQGMLISYATDPGNVAFDGLGRNSVYTEALLDNIGSENLDVRLMFGRVRQQVVRATGGAQVPWVEEAVLGEHFIVPNPTAAPVEVADELALWRDISNSNDEALFEDYLRKFPAGLFATIAEDRLKQLNQIGRLASGGADGPDELPEGVDEVQVASALERLGYLNRTRGLALVDADVALALDNFRNSSEGRTTASIEELLREAARLTVVLAASAGQRIRTDFAALASIEKTLEIADETYRQLVELAGDKEEYKDIVAEAAADIDAIHQSLEEVQRRLDVSRTYYHELLQSARDEYSGYIDDSLLANDQFNRAVSGAQGQLLRDAGVFVRHVRTGESRARGSYIWIKDFLTKS